MTIDALTGKRSSVSFSKLSHNSLIVALIGLGFLVLFYRIAGMRVYLFDFLAIFFLTIASANFLRLRVIKSSGLRDVGPIISLILLIFFTDALSIIGALYNGNSDVLTQFSKAILYKLLLTMFMVSFLIFNAHSGFKHSIHYLKILIFMVVASCLYQFIFISVNLGLNVNLDEIIWPFLSLGSWVPMEEDIRIGGGIFNTVYLRHGGFAGNPNMLVAQIVCILPITLAIAVFSPNKKWFLLLPILIFSLFLTLSRSGILGLIIILALFPVFFKVRRAIYVNTLIFFSLALPLLFTLYKYLDLSFFGGLYDLLSYRVGGESYFESSRFELLLAGIDIWSDYPLFGSGLSSSPVLLEDYDITRITGPSLHNYWLQLFVEKGILAMSNLVYYMFIWYSCFRDRSRYWRSLTVTLTCLVILGLSNNALGAPFVQVFLLSLFCAGCKERGQPGKALK